MSTAQLRARLAAVFIISIGVLACAFSAAIWFAPGPGHPPDIEEAHEDFIARYPDVTVNEVRITRDEAAARSFDFDYRKRVSGSTGRINVQYVERGGGKWEIQPAPPAQLP